MSSIREEAITLRKQGLSLRDISSRLGVAKGTLSGWLKNIPLTEEQRSSLLSRPNSYHTPKKFRGEQSKLWGLVSTPLSNDDKARTAEAAVLLRATILGLQVYGSVFDGDKTDWVVQVPSKRLAKLQVKFVAETKQYGLPHIKLTCSKGHSGKRRYQEGEFDFIVGYDLYTDIAYVCSAEDVAQNKSTVTVASQYAESWQKVLNF